MRALRHWTIHRAWNLFRAKQRDANEKSLQRQYLSMKEACEALRLLGEDGLAVTPDAGGPQTVWPPAVRDPQAVTLQVAKDKARVSAIVGPRWAEQGRQERAPAKAGEQAVELNLASAAARQRHVGRLYRRAMERKGLDQIPIEYARLQTDTPPRNGWDHSWKRDSLPPAMR